MNLWKIALIILGSHCHIFVVPKFLQVGSRANIEPIRQVKTYDFYEIGVTSQPLFIPFKLSGNNIKACFRQGSPFWRDIFCGNDRRKNSDDSAGGHVFGGSMTMCLWSKEFHKETILTKSDSKLNFGRNCKTVAAHFWPVGLTDENSKPTGNLIAL